jgi:2'-5' RNA ligase
MHKDKQVADTNGAGPMRLFIAIALPEPVLEQLAATMQRLQEAGMAPVRWVRPEAIHLTLKFLGEVSESQAQDAQTALGSAIHAPLDLELGLGSVGTFGGPQRTRVVWVGISGQTEALAVLAATVDEALSRAGFLKEARPFRPHLTLGRVQDSATAADRRRIHDLASAAGPPAPMSTAYHEISLIRSILGPGGARYERLATFPLREHPDA